MDHFAVVFQAARKALLEAADHQKVAQALEAVSKKLNEADADSARVVQLTEKLAAADAKIGRMAVHLEAACPPSDRFAFAEWIEEALKDPATKAAYDAERANLRAAAAVASAEFDEPEPTESGG